MKSKRRKVEAALFGMDDGTVREIAAAAGCTEETARRHLGDLQGERLATLRQEIGRGRRPWWVNVWRLTERGREVFGVREIIEEDMERLVFGAYRPIVEYDSS